MEGSLPERIYGPLTFKKEDFCIKVTHNETKAEAVFTTETAKLLLILMTEEGLVSKETVYRKMFCDRPPEKRPEPKILNVYVTKIRQRINGLGPDLGLHLWTKPGYMGLLSELCVRSGPRGKRPNIGRALEQLRSRTFAPAK